MTNPKIYVNLTLDKLNHILRGDEESELYLMNERYQCLLESGKVLIEKFEGKFYLIYFNCMYNL